MVSGHLIMERGMSVNVRFVVGRAPVSAYLVSTHGTQLLQTVLGVGLVAGADDTVVHVA